MSEVSSLNTPYPTGDTPVSLPSGTVIRVRNLVVLRGNRGQNAVS